MNLEVQQAYINYLQVYFSSGTVQRHKVAMEQFFLFCRMQYDEVTVHDIREWQAYMVAEGLKPKSIQMKTSVIKSFYLYLMAEDRLEKSSLINRHTLRKEDYLPSYIHKQLLEQKLKV